MIRLLIADDHAVVRTGLEQLIATFDGVELVGAAGNGEDAVRLAGERGPDVVLMDIEMPGLDGIEATRRITADDPEVAIVVLTSFSDREQILRALDAGAVGYLLKDAEPDELERAVRAAARGEAPLDPRALLAARRYSEFDGHLVLEVTDPAGQTTRLAVDGNRTDARCEVTDAEPDLVCSTQVLGACLLGGNRWNDFAQAGLLEERSAGRIAYADAMFATTRAPACTTGF